MLSFDGQIKPSDTQRTSKAGSKTGEGFSQFELMKQLERIIAVNEVKGKRQMSQSMVASKTKGDKWVSDENQKQNTAKDINSSKQKWESIHVSVVHSHESVGDNNIGKP